MKKYAVVVGVSRYDDPEITDLSFAASDAAEIATCLIDRCGFDEVRTLSTESSREPSHTGVVNALHSLAPLLSPDDLFLFYFAGHGIETGTGSHLLTCNSVIRMPELASISTDVLRDCLSRIECADRVLLLDACRNDPRKGMGEEDNLLGSGFSRDIMAVAETPVEGVVPTTCVLFSCRLGERAYEWPDQGHGAFTHYLLEGIRGAAADDRGRITVQGLGRYVEAKVPRWANKAGTPRPQTPWGEQKGSWREILLASPSQPVVGPAASSGQSKAETIVEESAKPGAASGPAAHLSGSRWRVGNKIGLLALMVIVFSILVVVHYFRRPSGVTDIPRPSKSADSTQLASSSAATGSVVTPTGVSSSTIVGSTDTNEPILAVSKAEAIRRHRRAAEQGNARAQFNLGWCYHNGIGAIQDYVEAVRWYRKAAEQGDAEAQCNLGWCYDNGQGVTQDEAEAVRWYHKAAEQGLASAQFNLGTCYRDGTGVSQDYAEAVRWYRKAAEQGHATAQLNLGWCISKGQGAAQDEAEVVRWYRKAAEQGDAEAQCNLGWCYHTGIGVVQNTAEAARWYRKAAEQGNAMGQYNLGLCFKRGEGVTQDDAEAVRWYRMAAAQGDADAQFKLGECYRQGTGVSKDQAEAVRWYRKAAEQGHQKARDQLGE